MTTSTPGLPRETRDYRRGAILAVPFSIALIAIVVSLMPGRGVETGNPHGAPSPFPSAAPHGPATFRAEETKGADLARNERLRTDPSKDPRGHVSEVRRVTLDSLDALAREALKRGLPEQAAASLLKAMYLVPEDAEAFHLMGDVMMQRGRFGEAREYYESAIDRNPLRADAYFGHATASEAMGDLESALGGMRSYLHVVADKDPFRLKVAQARSAIWEWESRLGRGPWGPTRGIPPGFTEAELRRDDRGVGVKIQIPGTADQDGVMKYEVKHADKIKMFEKE
jgi:hypothetical protein